MAIETTVQIPNGPRARDAARARWGWHRRARPGLELAGVWPWRAPQRHTLLGPELAGAAGWRGRIWVTAPWHMQLEARAMADLAGVGATTPGARSPVWRGSNEHPHIQIGQICELSVLYNTRT